MYIHENCYIFNNNLHFVVTLFSQINHFFKLHIDYIIDIKSTCPCSYDDEMMMIILIIRSIFTIGGKLPYGKIAFVLLVLLLIVQRDYLNLLHLN